jgi:hypothetical protein
MARVADGFGGLAYERVEVQVTVDAANFLPASTMRAGHERSAICPSREQLMFRERSRQIDIIDSIAFV